jgi:hypothetical protein
MAYEAFLAGETVTALKLNTRIVEEVMEWTDLADLGSFATNFSANVAMPPRMRKLRELGSEVWVLEGRITVSGGALTANTTHTMFTFDVGHRVSVEREFATGGSASDHFPVRTGFMTSGTLTGSVPTEAGSGTTLVWLDGIRITTPV